MGKAAVLRKQDKAYLELPQDLSGLSEIEFIQVREGIYLLSAPKESDSKSFSDVEKAVLRKLTSIRFEKRTPENVSKSLTEAELIVLKSLERKGAVNVFIGKKYVNGVYNIRDDVYPILRDTPHEQKAKAETPKPRGPYGLLHSKGFLTLNDKNEAFNLSQNLKDEIRAGAVLGIKGFDGRFYAVTRAYLESMQPRILSVLNEDMDLAAIASRAKIDAEGCAAVLRLMAENGDVLEKKKGLFAPV